ncbi:MAG: Na(+)/glucose symporter [Verrucomicrobiota bacterium]|jgi:Na+/proline symporter
MPGHALSLTVIAVYLVLLLALGVASKRFVRNTSDYFRSGSRGTWWLAGSSIFMGYFSAWTFTGAAAMAYTAGWSILAIYLFGPITALLQAWRFGPWFRQLRATTVPEVIRARFGPVTQQFYAVLQLLAQFLGAAIALYGLSIFIAAFFGVPVEAAIIVLGVVVLIYSTVGGSWAVMAADYVQSLVVLGMVTITAGLSLWHLGGLGGMLDKIEAAGLMQAFRFIKDPGEFTLDKFTLPWVLGLGVLGLFETVSLTNSVRYFSVKDGREARKAALLLAVLSVSGILFWFLPPMAGRLLFADQIMATSLDRPEEGAYAVTSMLLLPKGMAGLLAVAIIATTLSGMDAGLNRNAAIIVREICPAVCGLLGRSWTISEERQLRFSRWISLVTGVAMVLMAMFYASRKTLGIFDIMQIFASMVAVPITVPMGLALLFRRVPAGAAMVSVGCGCAVALWGFVSSSVLGEPWSFHFTIFAVSLAGTAGFFATRPFWGRSPEAYRRQVDEFFTRMERPVDFVAEIGESNDAAQLRILGVFALVVGALSALLLFTAESWRDAALMLGFCCFLGLVGGGMLWAARRQQHASPSR